MAAWEDAPQRPRTAAWPVAGERNVFPSAHTKLDADVQSFVAAPATSASAFMMAVDCGGAAAVAKSLCTFSTRGSFRVLCGARPRAPSAPLTLTAALGVQVGVSGREIAVQQLATTAAIARRVERASCAERARICPPVGLPAASAGILSPAGHRWAERARSKRALLREDVNASVNKAVNKLFRGNAVNT